MSANKGLSLKIDINPYSSIELVDLRRERRVLEIKYHVCFSRKPANIALLEPAISGLYAKDTGVSSFAYVERFLL